MLPYYCFKYGVKGFEFWGLAWWTYNPWQVGWHQFIRQSDEGKKYYWVRYPDGDGFLAYPGKPAGMDGPASTIPTAANRRRTWPISRMARCCSPRLRMRATAASSLRAKKSIVELAERNRVKFASGACASGCNFFAAEGYWV